MRHRTLPIDGLAQLCTILKSVGDFLTVIASLRITARAVTGLLCSSVPQGQPLPGILESIHLLV